MTHNTSTCLRDLETVRTYTKEERKLKHSEAHSGPGWKGAEWTGPVGGSRQAVPRDAGGRRAAPQPACLAPHALQLMSERGRQNPNTSGDLTITLETSEDRRSCTCSDVRPGLAALSSGATPQAEGMRPPGTRDSQASPRHSAHQPTAALGTWAEGHCPATWTQKGRRKRLEPAACAQRASRFEISCLDGGGGLLLSRPDPGASWLFTQKAPRLPDSDGVIVCPESALCPETSPFLSTLPERGLQPDRG